MKIQDILTVIFCLGANLSALNAQENDLERSNIFNRNHFSLEYQTGLSATKFEAVIGNERFVDRSSFLHLFSIGYQFNFLDHFGLRVSAGLGGQAIRYQIDPDADSPLTDPMMLGFSSLTMSYTRLGLEVSYHQKIKDSKWGFDGSLGSAFSFYGGASGGVSSSIQSSTGLQQQFRIDYNSQIQPIFLINANAGITRELKNRDLIGLYLTGEYLFSSIITGSYGINNNTSTGTFVNNGSNIGLKLRYSFTRSRKLADISAFRTDGVDKKDAKQAYKRDKRNTDPKNMFITAGSGLFFGRNHTKGSLPQVRSSAAPSWVHYVRFEKGTANNYFYEGGISLEQYWSSFRMKNILTEQITEFIASTASFGYGKRFIRQKTNWNFLTISAGAAVSSRLDFIDYGFSASTSGFGPFTASINKMGAVNRSPVFFSLYGSITHDVRLSNHLLLSLNYRFHQGLNTTVEETAIFQANPGNLQDNLSRKINGTSSAFNVGLKYRIPNRK